jgi:hypothetical protein
VAESKFLEQCTNSYWFRKLGRGLLFAKLGADDLAGDHSNKTAHAIHPAGRLPL